MTAVAIQHREEIIAQVALGTRICDIAAQYNISQPAISKVLAHDPEFIQARENGALARIELWEKRVEAINKRTGPVMFARAREMLSHARWRAEREFPARFGQKVEHSGVAPVMNISIQVAQPESYPQAKIVDSA